MKVQDVMTRAPASCKATDALVVATRIMWEDDCGCVPVVDDRGTVVGMVTDRDACMAAYTRGRRLDEIQIGTVMSRQLRSCSVDDPLNEAESLMQKFQVRRLPVVDKQQQLVGVLSCNDLIRHAAGLGDAGLRANRSARLLQVLAAIGDARPGAVPATTGAAEARTGTAATAATATSADVIPAVAPAPQPQAKAKDKDKKAKSKGR